MSLPNNCSSYHKILFVKINLNITLPSTMRSSSFSPAFRLSDQNFANFILVSPYALHVAPIHLP